LEKLLDYFPQLDACQKGQFESMGELYGFWNRQINVISRKDIDYLYERHILHSLAIAKVVSFVDGASVLDVGTGGGFPGLPLAIVFPKVKFLLIDSIGKKLKVVDAIAEALQLQNITTQHIRAEDLSCKVDFAVSRAVTSLPVFLSWMKNKFLKRNRHSLPNGTLFLKGGDITDELQSYRNRASIFEISQYFSEIFFEEKKIVHVSAY